MTRLVDPDEALRTFHAAGLEPCVPFPGSTKPWRAVHLACGEEITPTLVNVRRRGSACRACAAVRRGEDRRAARAADAARVMEEARFTPLEPYPGLNTPWRCRHNPCGLELTPRLSGVRRGDRSCRTCGRVAKGHRVWTEESARAAFEAAGLDPCAPYPGSSTKPWPAIHVSCGSKVSPRLVNVAEGQGPCRACGRIQQALTARLPEAEARAVVTAAELEPLDPYPGADLRWRCRHIRCGREVFPSYSNVKKGQQGCTWCAQRDLAVRLRMPESQARSIMLGAGLTPVEPHPGSAKPWASVHGACGRTVSPTLSNVRQGAGICRYCFSTFPFDGPAVVYLAGNTAAWKIGIAAVGSDRLRQHRRRGWTIEWALEVPTGDMAWNAEHAVLAWWRHEVGAEPAYAAGTMPQGGETETVGRSVVSAEQIRDFVEAFVDQTVDEATDAMTG